MRAAKDEDIMSHNNEAREKIQVLSTEDKMGHPQQEAEAPLTRSLGGLACRFSAWRSSPEVRVWAGPAFRALGICGVLSCVAFLGKQSEKETSYGSPIEIAAGEAQKNLVWDETSSETSSGHAHGDDEQVHAQTAPAAPAPCGASAVKQASGGITADGRIIMNEASQSEFTQLPGVGDARADAIVKLRERMGKFRSINDLLRVRGIGWKTLQTMKERLVVDRPAEEETAPEAPKNAGDA
jgi:competence ComEA-like helix-hairpin-helix protein